MSVIWWATDRATEPPVIEMLSREDRKITVGLSSAVSDGAAILIPGMSAEVRHYRHGTLIDPDPKSAILSFDAPTKVVAQKIDAGLLPINEPCVLIITFDVSTAGGIETRSVYVILEVSR